MTFIARPSDPKLALAWDVGKELYGEIERMQVTGLGYWYTPSDFPMRSRNCFKAHWWMNSEIKERQGKAEPAEGWDDSRNP